MADNSVVESEATMAVITPEISAQLGTLSRSFPYHVHDADPRHASPLRTPSAQHHTIIVKSNMPACGTRGTQTIISMDCGSLLPLFRGSPAAVAVSRITRSSPAHAKSLSSAPDHETPRHTPYPFRERARSLPFQRRVSGGNEWPLNSALESQATHVLTAPLRPHVTRHTSHVTRHTSHVSRLTSHVTRHTSHVSRLTSHVSRLTSHVSRLTSHVSRLTSHALRSPLSALRSSRRFIRDTTPALQVNSLQTAAHHENAPHHLPRRL
jgi:hypothetical protein